jgi:hypothetical protein
MIFGVFRMKKRLSLSLFTNNKNFFMRKLLMFSVFGMLFLVSCSKNEEQKQIAM